MSGRIAIGIASGIGLIVGEVIVTGSVSELTVAAALSLMGLGWLSKYSSILAPIISSFVKKSEHGQEVKPPPIAPPEPLPKVEELRRQEKTKEQRKKQSDNTKMKKVKND